MRYLAPADVTGITLSTGPLSVVDGFVEVPDDVLPGDLGGLAVNGFVPVKVVAENPTPTKPPKVEPAGTASSGAAAS